MVNVFFVNEKIFGTFGAANLCAGYPGIVLLEEERYSL